MSLELNFGLTILTQYSVLQDWVQFFNKTVIYKLIMNVSLLGEEIFDPSQMEVVKTLSCFAQDVTFYSGETLDRTSNISTRLTQF